MTDFHALESMLSGDAGDHDSLSPPNRRFSQAPSIQQNRFSRYLRFARRRHHELGAHGDNITHMPTSTPATADDLL